MAGRKAQLEIERWIENYTRGERARQPLFKDDARQRVMGGGGARVYKVQLVSMNQGTDVRDSQ